MALLKICLLGSFQAWLGGNPVTSFESNKVRALLAYLAVEKDRPHSRDTIAGLLWPDYPQRFCSQQPALGAIQPAQDN